MKINLTSILVFVIWLFGMFGLLFGLSGIDIAPFTRLILASVGGIVIALATLLLLYILASRGSKNSDDQIFDGNKRHEDE